MPNNRCYLRGLTLLGLFNTAIGCLFNRVLVRKIDEGTRRTIGWFWDIASNHPMRVSHEESKIQWTGNLTRLELKPGDILVLKVDEPLPLSAIIELKNRMAEAFQGHKVLVLDKGMELGCFSKVEGKENGEN